MEYLVTSAESTWEWRGVRFHAAEELTGPGAHTITADPLKATRWKERKNAEREARCSERIVTMEEAWRLVLENPLPSWSQNRESLLRRATIALGGKK